MSWKLKYRCKTCGYEAEVYEGRGLFRQQITPMSCPEERLFHDWLYNDIFRHRQISFRGWRRKRQF